ncbi:SMP-30/gluconolactonase/LRE family protein [Planctomicrobium sp. SH661]|uniref:SMP-30/gluconolactonase/LRE family protein n=1 Tax=Planctomicrobium sp. SH661 TaxID=3448124 RepID=UPI003F5C7D58
MIELRCVRTALFLCLSWGSLIPLSASFAQDSTNYPVLGEVVSLDPEFDELIAPGTPLQVVTSGFIWSEGPVWIREADGPGYLLFSDIPRNSIMKWVEGQGASVFMKPSGYTGVADYGNEPGSNGLLQDLQGRLVCCEHGDRRLSVLTVGGGKRTLVDNYQGRRLNSPNDAVLKSSGDIYFTDPPYGLPEQLKDPRAELDFCGVYKVTPEGALTLLTKEMTRPNGIAFSPDEKILYVAQSDPEAALWMAFPVNEDGTIGAGTVFAEANEAVKAGIPGLPDGLAVDHKGNVFASAPGGIWVFNSSGKLLGKINTGEATGNCTFGGADGSILYIVADTYICRIQTKTR